MTVMKLRPAGLDLYQCPKGQNRWYLPVCSALRKEELDRLGPRNPTCWEEVDFDGCPTVCYIFTRNAVKDMHRAHRFTEFYAKFKGYLGDGPAKAFFYDLWLRDNNERAMRRNRWEYRHNIRSHGSTRNMTVRNAAWLSVY